MSQLDPITGDSNEEKLLEDQLRSTLRQDLARALDIKRPVLTHLNADTTWLLSIPIPQHARHVRNKKRKLDDVSGKDLEGGDSILDTADLAAHSKQFFHVLIDPWLKGSQSDVAQFFSQQWHANESAVQTISEVEDAIRNMEHLASLNGPFNPAGLPPTTPTPQVAIDAVVVSHEFTDHMHKETLLEIPASVPVFASYKAASAIKSWRHFDVVVTLPTNLTNKNTDWRTTSVAPLPPWLGISRLGQDKIDLLYYHSAVMIAFSSSNGGEGNGNNDEIEDDEQAGAEAVIYTPHGITTSDLAPIITATPPSSTTTKTTTTTKTPRIRTLALLHGLHDVRLGGRRAQLNLGAHNGLKVQRLTRAKYWVGTHDEVKRGGGIVSWFLQRRVYTVKEAVEKAVRESAATVGGAGGKLKGEEDEEENGEREGNGDEGGLTDDELRFVELGNGESLILE